MNDLIGSLPTEEQRQARAVKAAIEAAGGLFPCSQDTGKSEAQLSRTSSPNYHHSLSIRDVQLIEASGHGRPGHPHITRHLCRAAGGVFVPLPGSDGNADTLMVGVAEMVGEFGDVSRSVIDALSDDGEIDDVEARVILRELDDVDRCSAQIRMQLDAIVERSNRSPRDDANQTERAAQAP